MSSDSQEPAAGRRRGWAILDLVHDRADLAETFDRISSAAPESDRRLRAVRGSHADVCRARDDVSALAARPLCASPPIAPHDRLECRQPDGVHSALPGQRRSGQQLPAAGWRRLCPGGARSGRRVGRRPRRRPRRGRAVPAHGAGAVARAASGRSSGVGPASPSWRAPRRNRRAHSESHVRLHRPAEAGRDPRGKRSSPTVGTSSTRWRSRPTTSSVATVPMAHSYGMGNLLLPLLLKGSPVVLRDRFVHAQWASDVKQLRRHDVSRRAVHLRLFAPRRRRRRAARAASAWW